MKDIIVTFLVIFFCIQIISCNDSAASGFNRSPAYIHYSKHAKCRMECRHVNESEVKEIITDGKINYSKSDLNEEACNKRYALEGYSYDNQKLRVVVAECNNELTVITVIDLGKDWVCDCE